MASSKTLWLEGKSGNIISFLVNNYSGHKNIPSFLRAIVSFQRVPNCLNILEQLEVIILLPINNQILIFDKKLN